MLSQIVDEWEEEWHAPLNLSSVAPIVEPPQIAVATNWDDDETVAISHVAITQSIPVPKAEKQEGRVGYRNVDLEDSATTAAQYIFRNSRISTNVQVRIHPDFGKLRIYGSLNKLWSQNDVCRFLKSAIDFYDKEESQTTTKTSQKEIDRIVKAIDKVNGSISALAHQVRMNPGNVEYESRLAQATESLNILQQECSNAMAKSTSEKKVNSKKLKELSQNILRILSKGDSRAHSLHTLLLQKINPSGYDAMIEERRRNAEIAKANEEYEREANRERYRINKIIEKYTFMDKIDYMKARELYLEGKYLPRDLARFKLVIEHDQRLTFDTTPAKPAKKSVELNIKQQFPDLVDKPVKNAWDRKLGSVPINQPQVATGAWVRRLDTEVLRKLPDVPKERPNKSVTLEQVQCNEDEFEEDDTWEKYYQSDDSDVDW